MILIKEDQVILIPGHGTLNIYSTLKSTRYSVYVPYLSILVKDSVLMAVMRFFQDNGFADMRLEEYLAKLDL